MRFIVIIAFAAALFFFAARIAWAEKRVALPPSQVKHPRWAEGAVIYELNTRQFTPEGTFNAVIRRIPELKALGVDIIWFMPIHPIGKVHRKGTLGSPYAVKDYGAVNPELGSIGDFKALVDAIHKAGMHVIIDLVANHTAWDSPLVKEHPGWYVKDEKGKMVPPVPDWTDVVKLDYSNASLREYMWGIMEYWVKDIGIDGFRCDVAAMVPTSFWDEARSRLERVKQVFMLAEAEKPALLVRAFDSDYATEYFRLFNDIAAGRKKPTGIGALLASDASSYPAGSWRMYFTSNHDQNSWLSSAVERLGVEGAKAFAVLTFTLPGMPLIYNGQEIGSFKKLAFFEKDPIEWGESPFRAFYRSLSKVHREHPVLYRGTIEQVSLPAHPDVIAFLRSEEGEERLMVIVNLSSSGTTVEMSERYELRKSLFGEDSQSSSKIMLSPWGYGIYEVNGK